jgi:hypothetical protein
MDMPDEPANVALRGSVWSTDREQAHMEGSNPVARTHFNRKH